ncbi:MAG: DUF2271 domain-containing protein [bacterium]
MRDPRKMLLMAVLMTALPLFNKLVAEGTNKTLEITLSVRKGTGDDPMVVLWLENNTNEFIRTVRMFSQSKKYHKDLLGWAFKSRPKEKVADIDAVTGATIRWNKKATVSIPVQMGTRDLLDGTYILRIESRKDEGNHYRGFKIPLPAGYSGGMHEDEGYVKSVEIKVQ